MTNHLAENEPQPIKLAATVVIARDAHPQYEILMLKRTSTAVFAGGMYVFPGGMVDPADGEPIEAYASAPSVDQAGQTAAVGAQWPQFWLAGIRETFEESGLLLAYDASGEIVSIDAENEARFLTYRNQVFKGDLSLISLCQREGLTLAFDRVHFFNRLITPPGRPRRFDTHFFITSAPENQQGIHDGTETVDTVWISPSEALRLHDLDQFGMMNATQRQLAELDEHQSLSDLLEMAQTRTIFPTHAYAKIPETLKLS